MMEFVNGKDDIPYIMKWNIKFMFETTNQMTFQYLGAPLFHDGMTLADVHYELPNGQIPR
jgi:hypothetical protein